MQSADQALDMPDLSLQMRVNSYLLRPYCLPIIHGRVCGRMERGALWSGCCRESVKDVLK